MHLCGTNQNRGSVTTGYFLSTCHRLFFSLHAVDPWLNLVLISKQTPQVLASGKKISFNIGLRGKSTSPISRVVLIHPSGIIFANDGEVLSDFGVITHSFRWLLEMHLTCDITN